jgi:hypothetical protein
MTTESVTIIFVGLALGAVVALVAHRWGWQAGLGAATLVVIAGLVVVLTDVADIQAVSYGLLACAAISAAASQISGRRHVA